MLGSIYSGPFTVVDGAGVEITNLGLTGADNPTFNIDLTDTGVINTDIRDGGPFAHVSDPNAFHGIVLSDINDPTFGAEMFANVSLDS